MDNPYRDAIQPFGGTEENPITTAPELPPPSPPRGLAREQLSASIFEEQLTQYRGDCATRMQKLTDDPWFWTEPALTAVFAAAVGSLLTAKVPFLRPGVQGMFGAVGAYYGLENQVSRRDSAELDCIIKSAKNQR